MSTRLLDPVAVQAQLRRMARRAPAGASVAPWLHVEIARRMAERLALIRLQPGHVLEWSAALGGGSALLRGAYPRAKHGVVEPSAELVARSIAAEQADWWRRWSRPAVQVLGAADALPHNLGLIWANMVLHAVADPPALIGRWHQALAVDGFLMFSCFGPDSLAQLRAIYRDAGWLAPGIDFVDMHDLGDMLVRAGFADPVMDQETLTLTWADGDVLLAELRGLGGNVLPDRHAGLRTPRWKAQLLAALEPLRGADGRLSLRFEIAYGHAFKAAPKVRVEPTTTVTLEAMRTLVKGRRSGG